MSDYLSKATKPKIKPPMITLVGFPAAGKTTLAAMFPKPVFIQAEDSGTVFETWPEDRQPLLLKQVPESMPDYKISPKQVVFDQLQEIFEADHDYQTLVIDTTTSLQALFENEIVRAENDERSIQDCRGGYQKAYDVIAGWHKEIIQKCLKIRAKRGMTIIFLAHTDEYKRKNHPELPEQYTVYGMRMHKKSRDFYISECDAVIYIKQHESVSGAQSDKKGVQIKQGRVKKSKNRTLITSSDGVVGFVDAKNRYFMPTEIEFQLDDQYKPWETVNPLLEYIPFFNGGRVKEEAADEQDQEQDNSNQQEK